MSSGIVDFSFFFRQGLECDNSHSPSRKKGWWRRRIVLDGIRGPKVTFFVLGVDGTTIMPQSLFLSCSAFEGSFLLDVLRKLLPKSGYASSCVLVVVVLKGLEKVSKFSFFFSLIPCPLQYDHGYR